MEKQTSKSVTELMDEIISEQTIFNSKSVKYWEPLSTLVFDCIKRRNELNLSQKQLAERMKTTQSVISRFENMGRTPNYDFIVRLAHALGLKLKISLDGDNTFSIPKKYKNDINEITEEKNISKKQICEQAIEEYVVSYRNIISLKNEQWSTPYSKHNATYQINTNGLIRILNFNGEIIEDGRKQISAN